MIMNALTDELKTSGSLLVQSELNQQREGGR